MTTTQRQRPPRQAPPGPDPASRGLILVAVAVVLGVILLVKGGGVGFDSDAGDVEIGSDDSTETAPVDSTTTTAAPQQTSVPPAQLQIAALNAAGINGYAGQTQQFLNVAGYTSVAPITAAELVDETIVYFADGYAVDAMMLAQRLELEPHQVRPLPTDVQLAADPAEFPEGTNVAITLGPDVSAVVEGSAVDAGEGEGAGEGTDTGGGVDDGAGTTGDDSGT